MTDGEGLPPRPRLPFVIGYRTGYVIGYMLGRGSYVFGFLHRLFTGKVRP